MRNTSECRHWSSINSAPEHGNMGRCSQRFRFKRTQICKPTQRQSITISPFKLPKKLWRKMVSGTWRLPWCLERRKRNRPHDITLDSPSTEPLHFVRMFLKRIDRELFGLTGAVCSSRRPREMLISVASRSAHGPLEPAVFDPQVFLEETPERTPTVAACFGL